MDFKKVIFFLVIIVLVFFLSACRVKLDDVTIKCNELTGECTVTGLDDDTTTPSNNGGNNTNPSGSYDHGEYTIGNWTYKAKASAENFKYKDAYPFAEYVPSGNNTGLPLVIWLHGSGEGPNDCDESCFLTRGGNIATFPAIVDNLVKEDKFQTSAIMIAPHNHSAVKVKAIIEYAKDKYNVNENKIVLMGHSLGGNAVINYSNQIYTDENKNYFSALVVISGTQSDYSVNYNYFKLMPMKGYSEDRVTGRQKPGENSISFFEKTGHGNDYKDYGHADHGQMPSIVMKEDNNGNNVPDVLDWALYQNKNNIQLP